MEIKIDSRESNIRLFTAFEILSAEKQFDFTKEFLPVGDVVCGNIVIERKEASDFVSSIMDGRLREQAAKMCLNFSEGYRYVIIEGNPYTTQSNINHHAIIGKMTSLLVKHQIRLLFVDTPEQFAYACFSLIDKHINMGQFNPDEFVKLAYKVGHNEIITAMILQIEQVGQEKAEQIAEMYGYSFSNMVNNINEEDLKSIDGIGEVIAKKIVDVITKDKK